jgi:hypothetical protein
VDFWTVFRDFVFRLPIFISSCGLGGALSSLRAIRKVSESRSGFFEAIMSYDAGSDEERHIKLRAKLAALDQFYKALGSAQAAWSAMEDGLFEWFKQCTGMQTQLARAVFYSARSFDGRRDMLLAAIPFSPCDEKTRTGIRLCVKRARKYAEFRNRFSHGHLVYLDREIPQHMLAEGRSLDSPLHEQPERNFVTCDDLRIAALNFGKLADCLLGFHPDWQPESVCEQGCLEEIQALPTEANSLEQDPSGP